jgi:hypothetical protein
MSVVVDADVMESFDAVAQGLDLDEFFVEFVSEKPVFAPQRSSTTTTTTTIADAPNRVWAVDLRLASSGESRDLFPQSSFQVRGRYRFEVGEVGCNGGEGVPLAQALCRDVACRCVNARGDAGSGGGFMDSGERRFELVVDGHIGG